MVFIKDEGSQFDAPLEKIWRYMQTSTSQEHYHEAMRDATLEMDGANPVLSFETETPMGKIKNKVRLTFFAPVGFLSEYLDGPLKGSKVMQYYQPHGEKTGVTVVGEYVSPTMPDPQVEQAVWANLERAFNEDQANLRKFK